MGGGPGGERTVWEKDKLKSPKMPNRRHRIPAESFLQPNLKDWVGKRVNKDNQTGDCEWINIGRRREKR